MSCRRGNIAVLPAIWSVLVVSGCGWSGSSSTGLGSLLRVAGAQAMGGSISDPPDQIPATVAPSTNSNIIFPGVSNKALAGVVGPNANAAAIGVPGDDGFWLVPALAPDTVNTDSYDFNTQISFSPALGHSSLLQHNAADGSTTLTLAFRAVDDRGQFGEARTSDLKVQLNDFTGKSLVVSLIWDSPVDLDLHVLVPTSAGYTEVWSKEPAATPAIVATATTPASAADGVLDFDSNAACTIDNRDQEDVVWTGTPPSGHYIVRVEAFSLCGLDSAGWHALAYVPASADAGADTTLGEASGILTEASTRGAHGAGAGITAFEFDYP